ncbi:hypothetical protein ACJMK2_005370 [Sinanodonta woodiana]|uniref:Uncharacterized protein n=1 Tax=Sinanodonta woodiana TaxID=1069815 RepID=A0ABD3VTB5_SINWO
MAEEQELLMLPALGLPFTLGTLYNANRNRIVPAIALWEDAQVYERSNITHNTDVTTLNSLDSKMVHLNIRGNLIIRVLANTLEVKGSGAYLNDKKTSNTQARIVFETSGTTKDVFLSKKDFSKGIVDHEYIRNSGATHVVVRITYGYQFFLMLEKTCESEEEKMKIEGKLEVKFAKFSLQIEGACEASDKLNEDNMLHEFNVIIYGNVQIPSNPVSFEDAIGIYKRIPELVKGKECPMTVYLLPLATICSSSPKVSSHINEALLNCATAMFEDISNSEIALSGIQTSDIAYREPRIQHKARKLLHMLNEHKIWLQTNLQKIISDPKTEKDSSESEQIKNVLLKHKNSPFSSEILGWYVSKLEKEVRFMKDLVRMLTFRYDSGSRGDDTNREGGRNGITVDILSDEIELMIPSDRPKVHVLEIPIIMEEDELLKKMETYDPHNSNGWTRQTVDSLTLPFEDTDIQRKILACAHKLVNLKRSYDNVANKIPEKFICLFKAYDRGREPTLLTD